jgi:hypothetical protein
MAMSPKLLRPRASGPTGAPPVYPIRAIHAGGSLQLERPGPFTLTYSPSAGGFGDLSVFGTLTEGQTEITVSYESRVTSLLAQLTNATLLNASLEIALVDATDRVVGWGVTSTSTSVYSTNGNLGHTMTLRVLRFPSIPQNYWVIGQSGTTFSSLPSYIFAGVRPYQVVSLPVVTVRPSLWKVETYSPVYHWSI